MKKIILSLLIATIIAPTMAFALTPEEQISEMKTNLIVDISKQAAVACEEVLVPVYDLELIEFLRFLENNFENKSSTTSLSNIAIARYSQYKKNLQSIYGQVTPGADASTAELAAYEQCSKLADGYLGLAKEKMIQHIKKTGADKKATIMVEKYKAINNQLRELNLEISKMYGFFMTFKAKLPGFLQQCVTI